MNSRISGNYRKLDVLFRTKNSKKMWNLIRSLKNTKQPCNNNISVNELRTFYEKRFSVDEYNDCPEILSARDKHYFELHGSLIDNQDMPMDRLKRIINKLKVGCSPGLDGVTAEHLKYMDNSKLLSHILLLLVNLCIRHGVVPDTFTKGLLFPGIKKPNIDPAIPNNYRPIIISSTLSKILEIYILEECNKYEFNDMQYGFIPGRGTDMTCSMGSYRGEALIWQSPWHGM